MFEATRKERDFTTDWSLQPNDMDLSGSNPTADIGDTDYPEGFVGQYYSLSRSSLLLKEARKSIYQLNNLELVNRASIFLSDLQRILDIFELFRGDLTDLPPLASAIVDDGSILFEWDFDEYRFGFSIEPDPQESSWYLVTDKNLGNIRASGLIAGVHLRKLLAWLTGFIMLRS